MSGSSNSLPGIALVILGLAFPSGAAFAQSAGLDFPDSNFAWVLTFSSAKMAASGAPLSSPYRFPTDWNPPEAYPAPGANGWSFAWDDEAGEIHPMEWDPSSTRWLGPPGTSIGKKEIRADGPNKAKLCIHADVVADTQGGGEGVYTVAVFARALAGGASLNIFIADSGTGNLPDMETAMPLHEPMIFEGGQIIQIQIPGVPIRHCQWIVFEIDDPTPETPVRISSWGSVRVLYR